MLFTTNCMMELGVCGPGEYIIREPPGPMGFCILHDGGIPTSSVTSSHKYL